MFKQITFFLALIAFSAATLAEEKAAKAQADLKAAGLSQPTIDGLIGLDTKFSAGFPGVAGNKEASDKFVADFQVEASKFMDAMPAADKQIYDNYRKSQGI